MLQDEIIRVVRVQQRNLRRGVLPRHVQALSRISAAEFTYRRYMVQMWHDGELIRLGGEGSRRGYRLPSDDEKKCVPVRDMLTQTGALPVSEAARLLNVSVAVLTGYVGQMPDDAQVLIDNGVLRDATPLERMALEMAGVYPWGMRMM